MNQEKQPVVLQLAQFFESMKKSSHRWHDSMPIHEKTSAELRLLHSRVQELEAELVKEAARTAEEKLRADQMSQQHSTQAAVPEAIEQMAVDRYKVVPSHESMFHRWAVVAGNGTQQLYIGREVECLNMARKFAGAFLDGAFVAMQNTAPAHPAEGVPAQDAEAKIGELLALARIMVRTALDADNKTQVLEIKAAIESEVAFERALRAALANTQPAAQGMLDAMTNAFITSESDGAAGSYKLVVKFQTLPELQAAHNALVTSLEAQTKQGDA